MSVYNKKRKDGTIAWFFDFTINGRRYREVGGSTRTQALRAQEKTRNKVISGEYDLEESVGDPGLKTLQLPF